MLFRFVIVRSSRTEEREDSSEVGAGGLEGHVSLVLQK